MPSKKKNRNYCATKIKHEQHARDRCRERFKKNLSPEILNQLLVKIWDRQITNIQVRSQRVFRCDVQLDGVLYRCIYSKDTKTIMTVYPP